MVETASSSSAPFLPLPRQPSPLSLSSASHGDYWNASTRSSPVPSVFESEEQSTHHSSFIPPQPDILPLPVQPPQAGPSTPSSGARYMSIRPSPDSIIYRTTLKQLEAQTVTLKKLAKNVLADLAVVSGIYAQLDAAEDELLGSLGELSRWLGNGYGLQPGVWDEDGMGVRKVRRERRKREKEDLEVMVQHGVENMRGELKRKGLAGGGATTKYEKAQQGYYAQTGAYLAPNSTHTHDHLPSSQSTHSLHNPIPSSDKAQVARTAQIASQSYQHHSALLYAVPPSSLVCLDLLVSLHSWAGTTLPEAPIAHASHPSRPGEADEESTTTPRRASGLATPARITSRPNPASHPAELRTTLAESLASMAAIRSELLHCWSLRSAQQQVLEDRAARKQAEVDGTWNIVDSPAVPPGWTGPVTSTTTPGSKPKRAHKVHRSVGGRLRDLLSSSTSSYSLAGSNGDRASRASLDVSSSSRMRTESVPEHTVMGPPAPPAHRRERQSTTPPRPALTARHSVQLDREYRSPIITSEEPLPSPLETMHGEREDVGRKHEGVLWGPGTWEGLGRPNSKAKWEMTWVVLDHSKIYEYGGIDSNQYDCQAVIDLRFASVREGRDTDRRFVFEVISAKEGRRMYQATSESDMKMWLYAIANAIESCINGTSSVRTFDASKLRTASGALDDHALPARRQKPLGIGFPLPPIPSTPGNRRSMPPLSQHQSQSQNPMGDIGGGGGGAGGWGAGKEKRTRKTSFKNVLKSSGEKWLNRHSGTSFDLPRPSPPLPLPSPQPQPQPQHQHQQQYQHHRGPRGKGDMTPPLQQTAPTSSAISSTASPSRSVKEAWAEYDDSHDTTIEKRVYEMAGLGLGLGDSPVSSPLQRRVQSEGVAKHLEGSAEILRSRSADMDGATARARTPEWTMTTLRSLADQPGNNVCADCKRPTKASQWATTNLRGVPMVLFLCIRCCGLHRGLGTHISKPRAINLDHWSPESIALAYAWGNERGNAIWEHSKPPSLSPTDETIASYIQDKYVAGRWLSTADRDRFAWPENGGHAVAVGRAL